MKLLQKLLPLLALIITSILCFELVNAGYEKFFDVKSGSDRSVSLDWLTRLRTSCLYIVLNVIYLIWLFRTFKAKHLHHKRLNQQEESGSSQEDQQEREKGLLFYFSNDRISFLSITKQAFPFLLLAFLAFPIGTDIYLYLHYGLMTLSGENPFLTGAGDFLSELSPFIRWPQSSTYGPISILIFTISAFFIHFNSLLAIYIFKGFCLAFHLTNSFLVYRLSTSFQYQTEITLAYLIHPLLLFEQVSVAHIDVLMSTMLLSFIVCFQAQKYLPGILAIWAGFLTKTLPILWLPLGAIFLLQKRQWRSLLLALFLIVCSMFALQQTILPTADSWSSLLNPGVSGKAINSFQSLLKLSLTYWTEISSELKTTLLDGFDWLLLAILGGYYAFAAYKIGLKPVSSEQLLRQEIGWVTLILFLFATPWLMPWYGSILLAISAVTPEAKRFNFVVLVFCFAASCTYALLGLGILQSLISTGLPAFALLASGLIFRNNTKENSSTPSSHP